jgi:hypothetical protein
MATLSELLVYQSVNGQPFSKVGSKLSTVKVCQQAIQHHPSKWQQSRMTKMTKREEREKEKRQELPEATIIGTERNQPIR